MRYRALVFDFDGTLVDSNRLKRDAYLHVFPDHPGLLSDLDAVLEAQKTASRFEIIRLLAGRIPGIDSARMETEARERTTAYTDWVEQQILVKAAESPAAPLLPVWQKDAPLYICSLTPAEPLRRIVERAGWQGYFQGIEGYPIRKEAMLRQTTARHQCQPDQVLMVGDGDNDEEAARDAGTAFFRITQLSDLHELDRHLHS